MSMFGRDCRTNVLLMNLDNIECMNKTEKDKYSPEYLFWRKRIEGQIRHTMYEHPEFFTQIAYDDNMVGRMAKRIIGEIVAGTCTGNNSRECATVSAISVIEDVVESRTASSDLVSGTRPADQFIQPN